MTAKKTVNTQTPKVNKLVPRAILGRSQISGFAGLSDGDCFADMEGNLYILTPYNGGWALRHAGADGRADYSLPPHPEFLGVDYFGFIQKVNQLAA